MIRFLQSKEGTRKIFLGIILAFVIVSMVAYLGAYFNTDRTSSVTGIYASVGHNDVASTDVVNVGRRLAQQRFQGQAVPEQFLGYFNKQAGDQLIMQAAIRQESDRMGLRVSDQELTEELHRGELGANIFPNGQFVGKEKYEDFIAQNYGVTADKFEKSFKLQLVYRKLETIIAGGVSVPESQVKEAYDKQNVKVKFDYAVIKTEDLMKQISANESELRAWFEQNKGTFTNSIPQQRKARYVVVDDSKVKVDITDADLQAVYNQRQELFKTTEQVDVSHILVKTKEQAEDLKKQMAKGVKFEDLAKKFSDDPGSKDNGGQYKGVIKGQFVPEFEKVAFAQELGKVSDPVQTKFGYHLIRTDAHRQARVKPLSEVKAELEPIVRAVKASGQVDALVNTVETEARKDGLDKAAAKHDLTVVNTDFFNQSASLPGIGANASQFMTQAFAMPVKAPAQRIALAKGFAVAEILDSKPASTPTFEQAHAQVEQQFRNERASSMLVKKTQELADRAHALNDLKKPAKEAGATMKTSEFVGPSGSVPDLGSMSSSGQEAFALNPGQISGPINAGRNGVVLTLLERQAPSAEDYAKQKDELKDRLLQQKRQEAMELFLESLRKRMDKNGGIKINVTEAKRLTGNF